MEPSLQNIAELLEAAEGLFGAHGGGSPMVRQRYGVRPLGVFVASPEGQPLAVSLLEENIAPAAVACLAARLAEALKQAPCGVVAAEEVGVGRWALGMRLPPSLEGRLLVSLVHSRDLPTTLGDPMEVVARIADGLAWTLRQREEAEARLRTRIEHLQAEQETLRASHAEAIATAIEEREERLHEQQAHVAQLQAVMLMAADGIMTIDDTGRIESFNETACTIFGYTAPEVLGQNIAMLGPKREPREPGDYLDERLRQGSPGQSGIAVEVIGCRKDGSLFPLDLAVSEVSIGNRRILTGIFRDITARKKAEEELRRLHLQNEMILNSAGEGICGLDAQGVIIFANPQAEKMLGWQASELIGQRLHEVVHYAKPGGEPYLFSQCHLCNIQDRQNTTSHSGEVFWRQDGSNFPVEYTGTPIREGERIVGAVVTFRDTTERRMLESQLRQAQKLESIGQLAAGIAHEINTPTQYIGDNTRFLQDGFQSLGGLLQHCLHLREAFQRPGSAAEVLRVGLTELCLWLEQADVEYYLDEIPKAITQTLEGVDRVAKIVRSMKEFSHPGGEEMQCVDLNSALESTLTVSRNEWKYVADAVSEFDPQLPLVTCMPADCNQVFLNLIVNAAHAIADKVGKGASGKGTITVRTRRQGAAVEIQVEDTGTGIPEAIQARIFDPFFTTKEVGRGTGQGLAIAHSIVVEKHGGTITFQSRPGVGTTFVVRLPIGPDSSQRGRPER